MKYTIEPINATAQRIITIARQLFMQRGYRGVSINDIVTAAEITKPTLYYHFADKEELFVQVAIYMLAEMHANMQEMVFIHPHTIQRLIALVNMVQDTRDLDSRMIRQEAREHLCATQQQRISAAFMELMFQPICIIMQVGLEQSLFHGRSAEELALLLLCIVEGFHLQNQQYLPTTMSPAYHMPLAHLTFSAEQIVQLFLHGVCG